MKRLLILAILSFGALEAKPVFVYGDVHAMGGYPMAGLGIRIKAGNQALDFSGNACVLDFPRSLKIFHLRGLYCTYPQFLGLYIGGGFGLMNEPEVYGFTGSFESSMGLQWGTLFVEASSSVPFSDTKRICPGLTFGLGF